MTDETRNKLKIGVIIFIILFLACYGIFMYLKYIAPQKTTAISASDQIVFKQPTLQVFSYKTSLNAYPDRIMIHYPYLVVIRPDQWQSEIYNMQTKRKEKTVNEVLLDYLNGNIVYNKQGYQTYYNNQSLGLLCDQAFIKSTTEILCITRPDPNKENDKLISINTQDKTQKDVYSSENVLTALYFDTENLYVGEYNFETNKAFITINDKTATIGDLVNIIYPMQGSFFTASFKSQRNNNIESYYKINTSNQQITTNLMDKDIIVF